jgi:glycerophosphoryl diester phosphodiesterase
MGAVPALAVEPPRQNPQRSGDIPVIAHRGAHAQVPENTLSAFRKAIELHCDFVEMDVRSTKDGALVILHDATVDRTTNGSGNVAELPLSSIIAFYIANEPIRGERTSKSGRNGRICGGTRFIDSVGINRGLAAKNPNDAGLAAERVPTFDEALALCRGKIKVYVDHKTGTPVDVLAALERHEMLDSAVVYAPVDRLREFKRLRPKLRVVSKCPAKRAEIAALSTELQPLCLDGNILEWSRDRVDDAHKAGAQVWVDMLGPLDGPIGYLWAAKIGVDAMQTDHPETLLAWRDGIRREPSRADR